MNDNMSLDGLQIACEKGGGISSDDDLWLISQVRTLSAENERLKTPKMFPLQTDREPSGPRQIPWSVAEIAYGRYSKIYGSDQSLEHLAQRGGFSWGEMDELHPNWRKDTNEIIALKVKIAELKERADKTTTAEIAEQARLIEERDALKVKVESHLREFTSLENKIGDIYQITGPIAGGDEIESARQLRAKVAELEKENKQAQRDQYRPIWAVVDELNLGGNGCPDSLILEHVSELKGKIESLESRLRAANERVEEGLEALKKYSIHRAGCGAGRWSWRSTDSEICNCGLAKALAGKGGE